MLMIYRFLYPFLLLITGASTFLSPMGNVNKRPSLSTTRSTYDNLLDGTTTLLWMTEDDDDDDSINDSTWTGQEHQPELPYPLNKYRKQFFQTLQCYYENGDTFHIYILGTFHVWNQSAADVQLLLEVVQPDITFVELCPARFDAMYMHEMGNETEKNDEKQSGENRGVESRPTKSSSSIGRSRLERAALNYLVKMENGRAEELNSTPENEFFTAYKCWENQLGNSTSTSGADSGGANLFVLGDRPFEITWSRAWENLRKRDILGMLTPSKTSILLLGGLSSLLLFPGLIGLGLFGVAAPVVFAWLFWTTEEDGLREELEGLLFQGEDEVDGDGDDKAAQWLEEHKLPFPAVEDIVIRERDLYMACKLWQACKFLLEGNFLDREPQTFSAVAIVGAAHVRGMMEAVEEQFVKENNVTKQLLPLLQTERLNFSEEALIAHAAGFARVNPKNHHPLEGSEERK